MVYEITKARKSNPYPEGLKTSAGTKKSISGRKCYSNLSVESTTFSFFNFPSLNFLPPEKLTIKGPRSRIHLLLPSGTKGGNFPKTLSTSEQVPKMGITERKQRQAAWYQRRFKSQEQEILIVCRKREHRRVSGRVRCF